MSTFCSSPSAQIIARLFRRSSQHIYTAPTKHQPTLLEMMERASRPKRNSIRRGLRLVVTGRKAKHLYVTTHMVTGLGCSALQEHASLGPDADLWMRKGRKKGYGENNLNPKLNPTFIAGSEGGKESADRHLWRCEICGALDISSLFIPPYETLICFYCFGDVMQLLLRGFVKISVSNFRSFLHQSSCLSQAFQIILGLGENCLQWFLAFCPWARAAGPAPARNATECAFTCFRRT